MIGGILYSIGGYFLPFVSLGLLLFVVAFLTMCILPKNNENCPPNQTAVKLSQIIKIPGVMVNSLSIIATSISIGFLGATLEPHLRQFNLGPFYLGLCSEHHGRLTEYCKAQINCWYFTIVQEVSSLSMALCMLVLHHFGAGWLTNVCTQKWQLSLEACWLHVLSVSLDQLLSCPLNHGSVQLCVDCFFTGLVLPRFYVPVSQMLSGQQCKSCKVFQFYSQFL